MRTTASDIARFAPSREPCCYCEGTEGKRILFMGQSSHVDCLQRFCFAKLPCPDEPAHAGRAWAWKERR